VKATRPFNTSHIARVLAEALPWTGVAGKPDLALSPRPRRRAASPALLLIAAYLMLIGAWVFANPPGYTPDEPNQYTKAIGVGDLDPLGQPGKYGIGPGFGPLQLKFINQASRTFTIPPGLAPDSFYCALFKPNVTAGCLKLGRPPNVTVTRLTYVGTYEPFQYFLPGLAADFGHNATASLLRGRAVSALVSFSLLALAVLVLGVPAGGPWPLVGLMAAATPMVVFEASGLSPAGPEIGSALCVLTSVLRLTRPAPDERRRRLTWVGLAAGGMVLITARSLGFAYFGLYLLLLLALASGPRALGRLVRAAGRSAAWTVAGLILALVVEAYWQLRFQAHVPLLIGDTARVARQTLHDLPDILRQDIGSFGWDDVPMYPLAHPAWILMVVSLLTASALAAPRRERCLLAGLVVGALIATVLIGVEQDSTHFPLFGRYVLPIWVALPLVGGEILYRHGSRLGHALPARLPLYVAAVAAFIHVSGWWFNGRRYAVTMNGPLFFPPHAQWSPPLGWYFWTFVILSAAVAMLLAAAQSGRPAPLPATPEAVDLPAEGPLARESAGALSALARRIAPRAL